MIIQTEGHEDSIEVHKALVRAHTILYPLYETLNKEE